METGAFAPVELFEVFGEVDGRELLRLASADLRQRLAAFESSLASGDLPAAGRAAHSLAGVAGNITAVRLCEISRAAEGLLKAGRCPAADLQASVQLEASAVLAMIGAILRPSAGHT